MANYIGRGGKREGAGRPRLSPEATRTFRLPESIGQKAKSGYFEAVEALIEDWNYRLEDHGGKSRDWTKFNEFWAEFKQIKQEYLGD